ncbi:MAG: YncE family protein [Methanosarcina sp.]
MILMLVSIASSIPLETGPSGVAVSPDGSKVYVANSYNLTNTEGSGNNVSVINTATNSVIAAVNAGTGPFGLALTPDGTKLYVTNFWSNTASVIDTANNAVMGTVNVGQGPSGIAVSPDGSKAYVANCLNNTTSVIDTTNNSVITVVPVGAYPYGVTTSQDGTRIYVTSAINNNVSVIDSANNTVISTVNLGNDIFASGKSRDLVFVPAPVQEALKKVSDSSQGSGNITSNPEGNTIQTNNNSIELSGQGTKATSTFKLKEGLYKFNMQHDGSSNFIVWLIDGKSGKEIELLANEIGSFNGSHAVGIESDGDYVLNINADGNWKVTTEQPTQAAIQSIPLTLQGNGHKASQIFYLEPGMKRFEMKHAGSSNFIIWLMDDQGNEIDLVANEVGNFNGSKAVSITQSGNYLLNIDADGNWEVSIK